ncbi:protocadherin-1-like isoform X2 [Littorina saxatilis]|uniref:Cadherin domain-containing protein n=1 Tax=Littorina saxatilis TaxID=31220 RepID=A0AAN9B1C6_9CAEN
MKTTYKMIRLVSLVTLALLVQSQSQDFFRLTYNITEEQEPGIFVGNTALDTGLFNSANSQDFQDLKFELFASGDDNAKFFSIDEQNGVVRTKARIDREAVCGNEVDCTMILNMGVYRKTSQDGEFDFYRSIEVVVRVEDRNDNAPEFPQKVVTLALPENMPAPYKLYTSVATDPDKEGPNSNITYDFESTSDIFSLEVERNPENGLTDLIVKVNQMLDREAADSYYVRIVASDGGSPRQSGSVLINIAVTDRNDNAPVFMSSNYTVNVNENASIREPILIVSAVDQDINDNGQVLYKLGARVDDEIKQHFQIGETDGKVYLTRPVDFETKDKFVFVIDALDRGNPPQSSSAYIIVNIIDVNDNAPEIFLNLSPDGTDITEHEPAGKFLGHFSVSDQDSGVHGDVVCEIDDPNFRLDPFEGQPNVYKIVLAMPLDHEDLPRRQVAIRCRDSDKNPLLATKTFEVKVLDINDNAPHFHTATFRGSVMENEAPATNVVQQTLTDASGSSNVLRIVAEDLDSGDNGRVTYSIPVPTNFSIDALTGTLSTLVTFDREVQAQYTFPVVAEDHGESPLSATATVIITIQDKNDHPPKFAQPIYFLDVQENMEPGSVCGTIMALDEDSGSNARVVYSIVRDDDSSRFFSVNRDTGEVTTNQLLDRETRDSYSFTLEAQNPSNADFRDTTRVMVSVVDDNDHPPVISNPSPTNNTITLPNNTTVGSLILRVRATDGDDPKDTSFEYTIPGSAKGSLFQVITVTGELILAREIRPQDAKTHELLIVVSDGGSNPRSATATLLVTIPAEGMPAAATANILNEPNVIIIVVIIVVTLLVAILVFIAICCIYRRDRKRTAGRQQQRHVKDKMYQAAHWVSTHSLPPGDPNGSPVHETSRSSDGMGDKKGKKEVSFSLDEDMEKEGDPDTSGSLGSVFSAPTSGAPDNNNLKPPGDGRFITFISGKTSPGSLTAPYESSDGHTYHNTPIAETDDHLHMQLDRPGGEDALSASSGETGTDSGRGGSEDEAHSNRGSSLDTDSRSFHPAQSHSSGYSSFSSADRGRRKPPSLSSLPEEHHHHLPHPLQHHPANDHALHPNPQHHNYFRSSHEQLPTHGLGYPAGCSRNYSFNHAMPGTKSNTIGGSSGSAAGEANNGDTYQSMGRIGEANNGDTYHSMGRAHDGPFRLRDATLQPQGTRRTFHTFGPQHQTNNNNSHPAWRRARGLDGGWRSVTPTTTDDDDLTTTSGSYTLSPEEAPSDMDEVPFHQAHDIMV